MVGPPQRPPLCRSLVALLPGYLIIEDRLLKIVEVTTPQVDHLLQLHEIFRSRRTLPPSSYCTCTLPNSAISHSIADPSGFTYAPPLISLRVIHLAIPFYILPLSTSFYWCIHTAGKQGSSVEAATETIPRRSYGLIWLLHPFEIP